MKDKKVHVFVSYILGFIIVAHLIRAITLLNVTVGTYVVPIWVSWVVVIIGSYLLWNLLKS